MFNLPKPTTPKFPKPGIGIPEINILKYPKHGAVLHKYEISGDKCTIIITPKKYSLLGELLEVRKPIIINNPLCRKPPKNFGEEQTVYDILPIEGLYTAWMIKQQHYTYTNWFQAESASWELIVQSTHFEYKEYPGNAANSKNYECGYYQLADGTKSSEVYVVGNYTVNYDARIEDEPNRIPIRGTISEPRKLARWSSGSYRVDIYGNFISDAPENKPIIRDWSGNFVRYLEPEEIIPPFVVELPAKQKGVAITVSFTIRTKLKLNRRGGTDPLTNEPIYEGRIFTDEFSTSYTWDIYERRFHPYSENYENYYRQYDEPGIGNCRRLNSNYGLRWRDIYSLTGGGVTGLYGYDIYEFYIPGEWLKTNLEVTGGLRDGLGREVNGLPLNVWIDFNNQLRSGVTLGHIWITQNLGRFAIDRPYAMYLPIYDSYIDRKHQGYRTTGFPFSIVIEDYGMGIAKKTTWYTLENELPPMNDQCCDELKKLLKLVLKQQGTFPSFVPDLLTKEAPVIIKKESLADLLVWQIQQLDALVGKYPIEVEVEDTDLTREGNQTKKVTLPNIAETLAEVVGLLLMIQAESNANLTATFKAMTEAGMAKKAATTATEIGLANAEFLGYNLHQKKKKLPMTFTPGEEETDKVLKEKEVDYIGYENKDKLDLHDYLRRLLEMASMYKAQNFVRVANQADIINRLLLNPLELQVKAEKANDEDFDKFTEQIETGFTGEKGVTDPLNPWSSPREERPRIREIGEQ